MNQSHADALSKWDGKDIIEGLCLLLEVQPAHNLRELLDLTCLVEFYRDHYFASK
ncbi:hypothetical protein [Terasakiispira papahanaumokuakeensis]|uniref:hypothetical protein n=1 Tax=Terasakiispira papahanaumokuakeensis TaxID=197479 RepID=UPI0015866087|nr:hypothetical protein [Terasakiispira papahanaumokuakeensis]